MEISFNYNSAYISWHTPIKITLLNLFVFGQSILSRPAQSQHSSSRSAEFSVNQLVDTAEKIGFWKWAIGIPWYTHVYPQKSIWTGTIGTKPLLSSFSLGFFSYETHETWCVFTAGASRYARARQVSIGSHSVVSWMKRDKKNTLR